MLAQTSMPGVLIETGFITNNTEEQYLNSTEGQEYIASAIYRAFKDYKISIESKSEAIAQYSIHSEMDTVPDSFPPIQSGENKIDTVESSIYFKVQVVVSSTPISLNSEQFKDFSDIEEFRTNQFYKYAVGYRVKYDDIVEYSKWVKSRFPDAFIIAIKNGEIVPVQEALNELYGKS